MSGSMVSAGEILAAFREAFVSLPVDEIVLAAARWDELAPVLLERLEVLAPEDDPLLFVTIYLMGQQCETRAFPFLCHLAHNTGRLSDTMGDAALEDLDAILARTFDGDTGPLCILIEDEDADDIVRAQALQVLTRLVRTGQVTREWAEAYLRGLAEKLDPDLGMFWGAEWANCIASLTLHELVPLAEAAFQDERVDPLVMTMEDFRDVLHKGAESQPDDPDADAAHYTEFDAIDRMSAFSVGDDGEDEDLEEAEPEDDRWRGEVQQPVVNPLRHVGRNDPCVCGSGKKYKKCCLGK